MLLRLYYVERRETHTTHITCNRVTASGDLKENMWEGREVKA